MDSHLHSHRLSKAHWCTSVPSPSNYRMGTVGRTRFYDLTQRVYGSKNSCRSVHQYSLRGIARITPHLRPNLAMGNTGLVKSVHLISAPGNSKNSFTTASRPSYGKCRTRAKVFDRTLTPENSQYSTIWSSREERSVEQERGIVGATITVDTTPSSSPTEPSLKLWHNIKSYDLEDSHLQSSTTVQVTLASLTRQVPRNTGIYYEN